MFYQKYINNTLIALIFLFFASGCSKINFRNKDYQVIKDSQIIGQYSVNRGDENGSGRKKYTIYKAKDPYIINTDLGQVILLDLIHSLDLTATYLTGDEQGKTNYTNEIFENKIKIYVDKWNSCETSKADYVWPHYRVLSGLKNCGFYYDYFGEESRRGLKDPGTAMKGVQLITNYINSNITPLNNHFYSDSDFEEMFLNQN